jgi:ankyrin repeat protein
MSRILPGPRYLHRAEPGLPTTPAIVQTLPSGSMDDIRQSLRSPALLAKNGDYLRFLSLIPKKLWTDRDNLQIDFENLRACYQAFQAIHDALPHDWRDYLDKFGQIVSADWGKDHVASSHPELFKVFTLFYAECSGFKVDPPPEKYRSPRGLTPLGLAVEANEADVCLFFLSYMRQCCPDAIFDLQELPPLALSHPEYGTSIDTASARTTPLTYAVNVRASEAIFKCFKGITLLVTPDEHGDTPLRAAIRAGLLDHVRWLCDADTNMDAAKIRDFDGYLPLAVAVRCGQAKIVKELLERNNHLVEDDWNRDTNAFVVLWREWPKLDPAAREEISADLRAAAGWWYVEKMHQFAVEHALKGDYGLAQHLLDVHECEAIDLRFAVDSKDPRLMKMFLDHTTPKPDQLSEFIQRAEKIGASEIVTLLKAKAIAPEGGQ